MSTYLRALAEYFFRGESVGAGIRKTGYPIEAAIWVALRITMGGYSGTDKNKLLNDGACRSIITESGEQAGLYTMPLMNRAVRQKGMQMGKTGEIFQ